MPSPARWFSRFVRHLACIALALPLAAAPALAVHHVVNSTDDDADNNLGDGVCWTGQLVVFGMFGVNECTLRAAIQESNASAGADLITFTGLIPLDAFGKVMIQPTSALPSITTEVVIDGTSIPEWDENDPWAEPILYISGVSAGVGSGLVYAGAGTTGSELTGVGIINWPSDGLYLTGADGVTIQACHIGLFQGILDQGNGSHGIDTLASSIQIGQACSDTEGCSGLGNVISGNGGWGVSMFGTDNVIGGNRIGTDQAGLLARGNDAGGVFIGGTNNIIGDRGAVWDPPNLTEEEAGNLISGNTGVGIRLVTPNNVLYENRIGVDATGTVALANSAQGVLVEDAPNTIGADGVGGNVIAGNGAQGLYIDDETPSGAVNVSGNAIGVDRSYTVPIGNSSYGIYIVRADWVTISENVVSANGQDGIHVVTGADGNVIDQNYVGTNASGDDLGNDGDGIHVNSTDNEIGADDRLPNIIGHNQQNGVRINNTQNLVANNWIGTDASGNDIGNFSHGVYLDGAAWHNVVGADRTVNGDDLGDWDNTIANNAGAGIAMYGGISAKDRNAMRGNLFYANGGLAIDLANDGTTPNDSNDTDGGANNLQNHPEIDAAQTVWNEFLGELTIRYRVDTLPTEADYPLTVDFYVRSVAGNGDLWIGTEQIPSSEAGLYRTFVFNPPLGVLIAAQSLVATTTDADDPGNTSEYSAPIAVPEPDPWLTLPSGLMLLGGLQRLRRRSNCYRPIRET
jgi:CSLREA domain-containing protein